MRLSPLAPFLASVVAASALVGCDRDAPATRQPAPGAKNHAVTIHAPSKLVSIESGKSDAVGRPIRVACTTCHGVRDVDAGARFPSSAGALSEFHAGLVVSHGTLACTSCHADRRGGAPMLHLASGEELPTSEAMRLCAQCHGPKFKDWQHGSHGGMNGAWDLSRGDRLRNHCVDCHDPHVPAFQPSHPVLPPRDRGTVAAAAGGPHG